MEGGSCGGQTNGRLEVLAHEALEGVVERGDALATGVAGRALELALRAADLLQQLKQLAPLALAVGGCTVVHSPCRRPRTNAFHVKSGESQQDTFARLARLVWVLSCAVVYG